MDFILAAFGSLAYTSATGSGADVSCSRAGDWTGRAMFSGIEAI